jgi:uncharacterized membrane protein YraQ (UPF0718 family)
MALCNFFVLSFEPQIGKTALFFSGKNFVNFIFIITPVFICIGLFDIWIDRDKMIRIMGDKSGIKGIAVAMLSGMITAVPLYALLPVAGVLLKKGCKISNVILFLCTSASIRIPFLLFEISSLGAQFTLIRFGLNLIVVIIIAFTIERLLSDKEKKTVYENADKL